MRDLNKDLDWLMICKNKKDLTDDYLKEICSTTRKTYQDYAPEYEYGITFVESDIAYEWLTRAVEAEEKLEELVRCNDCELYMESGSSCSLDGLFRDFEEYCSRGERRGEE